MPPTRDEASNQDPKLSDEFGIICRNESLSIIKTPLEECDLILRANEEAVKKCLQQLNTAYIDIERIDISCTSICPTSEQSRYNISSDDSGDEWHNPHNLSSDCSGVRRVLFPEKRNNKTYPSKNNICFYCKKKNAKLSRHLTTVHKDEKEIKELLKFPKGSHERNKIFDLLRKRGNFEHNIDSREENNELFLVRKPHNKNVISENYKPCPNCKGYYSVKSLRQHYSRCCLTKVKGTRTIMVQSRAIERKCHSRANRILRDVVLPVMREDDICKAIRYDELAILMGNRLTVKFKSAHHHDMIRSKLRLMGRFILALRSNGVQIEDFQDALRPKYFNGVVKGINSVARLDVTSGKYGAPATAFALGLLLKDSTRLLITECIKQEDHERKKNAQDFLKLLESELNASVNKTVTENWSEHNRQKKVKLPSREDIKTLTTFLYSKRRSLVDKLTVDFSVSDWQELAKCTLVSVLIFNRRRPGELERSTIDDYKSYVQIDETMNKEIYNSLSEEGKKCAREYVRFRTRGKKGRTVPVLLDKFMKLCVELILEGRTEAGVAESNPYIFGIPKRDNTPKYLRAYRLLEHYSYKSGAISPETLKATELRKHVATTSVKLNLAEFEVENLQEFMGHADKIHKEYYRQPLVERDIINMSKLLTFAQGDRDHFEVIENSNGSDNSGHSVCLEENVFQSDGNTTECEPRNNRNFEDDHGNRSDDSDAISTTQETSNRVFRRAWSSPEKNCVAKCFQSYINKRMAPSVTKCSKVLAANPVLHNRNTMSLKAYVINVIKGKGKTPQRVQTRRTYWTSPEKQSVLEIFSDHIQQRRYPSMLECRKATANDPRLCNRSPKKIRSFIQYLYRKS